jgi:hypothetical protein
MALVKTIVIFLILAVAGDAAARVKRLFSVRRPGDIRRVAIDPRGRYVAAVYVSNTKDRDNRLRVFNVKTVKPVLELEMARIGKNQYDWRTPFPDHNVLSFTGDGKLLAYRFGKLVLLQVPGGKQRVLLKTTALLHAFPTRDPHRFLLRDRSGVKVLDASKGKPTPALELPCSKGNWCKEIGLTTDDYAYFTHLEGSQLARCHLKTLKCEKTRMPAARFTSELAVLPGDRHLVRQSRGGIAVHAIDRKPFRIQKKPAAKRRYKNEITLLAGLTPSWFVSGRRYYFAGFLDRRSFKAVAEWRRPAREVFATHVDRAPAVKLGVLGTTGGRLYVFQHREK